MTVAAGLAPPPVRSMTVQCDRDHRIGLSVALVVSWPHVTRMSRGRRFRRAVKRFLSGGGLMIASGNG